MAEARFGPLSGFVARPARAPLSSGDLGEAFDSRWAAAGDRRTTSPRRCLAFTGACFAAGRATLDMQAPTDVDVLTELGPLYLARGHLERNKSQRGAAGLRPLTWKSTLGGQEGIHTLRTTVAGGRHLLEHRADEGTCDANVEFAPAERTGGEVVR